MGVPFVEKIIGPLGYVVEYSVILITPERKYEKGYAGYRAYSV